METLQSTIFIEFNVNTKKITFLRSDNVIDYDSNTTSIYVRVKHKNLSGNTVYLTPSELKNYKFSLYTIKPATKNVTEITGKITDELKENVYGGVVKFEIPRVCTNRVGIVKCEIHINKGNKLIGSSTFVLDVKQSLVTAFDDELLGDEDFPVLKQLILEIQKASNINDSTASLVTTYSSDKIEIIKENIEENIEELNLQIKEKANISTTNNIQQQVNNLVLGAVGDGNNAEVIQARGKHPVLNDRLTESENNLNDIGNLVLRDSVNELDMSWIDGVEAINGISVTYNIDGTITLNGTATDSAVFYDNNKNLNGAGKIFTIRKVRGTTTGKVRGRLNIDSSTFVDAILDENTDVASVNLDNVTYRIYRVYINSGVTLNNYTISMQVEDSSNGMASEYEPFGTKIAKVAYKNDVKNIENRINTLKPEVDTLKSEVDVLKPEVDTLKSEVNTLKSEVDVLKPEVDVLKSEVDILDKIIKKNASKRYLGNFTKPYLCLIADDGTSNLTNVTIPILKNKNVPCTFALWSTSDIVTSNISGLQEMINDYGCGVAQHGSAKLVDENGNSRKSDLDLISYFNNEVTAWSSLGIKVNSYVFPYNLTNDDLTSIASLYFSFMASGSNSKYKYYLNSNRSNIFNLSRISLVSNTLTELKTKLDYAIENNMLMIIYWHDDTLANNIEKQTLLSDFIDYAKTTNINFITLNDLENI